MDTSPLEGWDSIVRETTDAFCKSFAQERDFDGAFAESVGRGALPHGVDPFDPRVIAIRRKCQERSAENLPFTD